MVSQLVRRPILTSTTGCSVEDIFRVGFLRPSFDHHFIGKHSKGPGNGVISIRGDVVSICCRDLRFSDKTNSWAKRCTRYTLYGSRLHDSCLLSTLMSGVLICSSLFGNDDSHSLLYKYLALKPDPFIVSLGSIKAVYDASRVITRYLCGDATSTSRFSLQVCDYRMTLPTTSSLPTSIIEARFWFLKTATSTIPWRWLGIDDGKGVRSTKSCQLLVAISFTVNHVLCHGWRYWKSIGRSQRQRLFVH